MAQFETLVQTAENTGSTVQASIAAKARTEQRQMEMWSDLLVSEIDNVLDQAGVISQFLLNFHLLDCISTRDGI